MDVVLQHQKKGDKAWKTWNRKEDTCYLQMTPELIDAVAISTLGTYQSKAARFVGDHMFGYGSQEGYSITNLGRIESDVIAEASFIPPASPANRKTQGILTVNGKMAICSAVRK